MHGLWIPIIGFLILSVLSVALSPKRSKRPDLKKPWPLKSKPPLTPTEQAMFARLSEALPDHIVLAQVQLSSFVEVMPPARKQDWHNRYHQMSADFLICDYRFTLLAAVELDDASHSRKDRIQADSKKEHILRSAGVPLIRWHAKQMPNGDAIRAALLPPQQAPRATTPTVAQDRIGAS